MGASMSKSNLISNFENTRNILNFALSPIGFFIIRNYYFFILLAGCISLNRNPFWGIPGFLMTVWSGLMAMRSNEHCWIEPKDDTILCRVRNLIWNVNPWFPSCHGDAFKTLGFSTPGFSLDLMKNPPKIRIYIFDFHLPFSKIEEQINETASVKTYARQAG